MAIAAPESTSLSNRVASSRLVHFTTSSIGLKLIMAFTGVLLSGFVLGHMVGNLKVFEGAKALNDYGALLRVEPAFLWTARLGLLTAVALHIIANVLLLRKTALARPHGYRVAARKESTYASRTMKITGPLVLAFIIFHILHLTTGTLHQSFKEGDVYHNVLVGLSDLPVALIYITAMAMLAFHLWHGVWSLFQTLGARQGRYRSLGRWFATGFTILVIGGFTAVPISILTGLVK